MLILIILQIHTEPCTPSFTFGVNLNIPRLKSKSTRIANRSRSIFRAAYFTRQPPALFTLVLKIKPISNLPKLHIKRLEAKRACLGGTKLCASNARIYRSHIKSFRNWTSGTQRIIKSGNLAHTSSDCGHINIVYRGSRIN